MPQTKQKFFLKKEFILPFILIIISSIIYFIYLGDIKVFRSDDEPLYAHIAAEMHQMNEFWVPLRFGETAFFKPPFLYWAMIFFFKFLGVSILSARIPVAIMTIASIFLVYIIGKDLFGIAYGFLASLILATSFGTIAYGRVGLMDTPLMFLILLAVYFFHIAVNKNKSWGVLVFFTAGAFSTLVKGPISALILFFFVLTYCTLFKKWNVFKTKWSIYGIAAGLIIVLLWPLMIYIKGLWHEWFLFFIIRENFGKFNDMYYSSLHFLVYYLEFLAPWSFFFILSLILIISNRLYKKNEYAFLLLILASCIIVFMFPATKLKHFLIPALPYGALIISGIIKDFKESLAVKITSYITILFMFLLFFVIFCIAWIGYAQNYFIPSIFAALFIIMCIFYLIRGRLINSAASYAFFIISMITIWSMLNMPLLPTQALAFLKENNVYVVRHQTYIYSYFLRRPVEQIEEPSQFLNNFMPGSKIVISEKDLKEFLKDKNFKTLRTAPLYSWLYWKEDISIPEFFSALKARNPEKLKENIYILKTKD